MSNNRFDIIYESSDINYVKTCPVFIIGKRLLYDQCKRSYLGQIKFKNITNATIKTIEISLIGLENIGDNKIVQQSFKYCNLEAQRDYCFGEQTPIYINGKDLIKIDVIINKIEYIIDNELYVWANNNMTKASILHPQLIESVLTPDLLNQYRRENNCTEQDIYAPCEMDELWICTCGGVNSINETECHLCKKDIKKLIFSLNEDYLNQKLNDYNSKLKKIAESWEKQKQAKRKHWLKIGSICILICFIVFGIIVPKVDNIRKKDFAKKFDDSIIEFYTQEVLDNYGRDLTDKEIGTPIENTAENDDYESHIVYGGKDYKLGGIRGHVSYEYDDRYRPYVTTISWSPTEDKDLRYIKYAFSQLGVDGEKPKKSNSYDSDWEKEDDESVVYYSFEKDNSYITSSESGEYGKVILTIEKNSCGNISDLTITWDSSYLNHY